MIEMSKRPITEYKILNFNNMDKMCVHLFFNLKTLKNFFLPGLHYIKYKK